MFLLTLITLGLRFIAISFGSETFEYAAWLFGFGLLVTIVLIMRSRFNDPDDLLWPALNRVTSGLHHQVYAFIIVITIIKPPFLLNKPLARV